jgi:superkiller protein 3
MFSVLGGCKKKTSTVPGQLKPGSPEYLMNEGLFHLNQGDANMAERKLQQALKKKPNMVKALNALGLVYVYKREFKKAINYFKRVLVLNPKYVDAHNSLGLIYSELNQYDLAKEHLLISANSKKYRTPENSFVNLAMLELRHNKIDSANRYIEKAIEKNRRFAPIYNIKGIILENQKKYAEAIASYKKALSFLTEEDLTTLINIGRTYKKMGKKNEALDMLEKALSKANVPGIREKIKQMIKEVEDQKK